MRKGRPNVRRFALVLEERHDMRAIGQHNQPLLQRDEQVLDLPGLVFGLVLFDFANGKSARCSVVAEQNPEASVSFLQMRRISALRSITAPSRKRLYQSFTKRPAKCTRQGPTD